MAGIFQALPAFLFLDDGSFKNCSPSHFLSVKENACQFVKCASNLELPLERIELSTPNLRG
jgi:hypothetical protein